MAQLDGYIRVSDVHGRSGDSFISPDQQRDKITAWAKIHDHEVVAWEEELDVSGGKLDRPKLDRIMERIRSGQTGGIAIAKLDRFSRAGVGDALALIEEIKEAEAVFGCVEPTIDTDDKVFGEFALTLFLALARMERQRIGATWSDARARSIKRGRHVGQAPFGYRKRSEDGKLEPDPLNAPYVTEIFERRAAGQSWRVIASWLTDIGCPSPRGNGWLVATLGGIVNNEVYLGTLSDRHSGERLENAHPPLVDPLTWQAAQARRGVRFSKLPDAGRLLRGLVRCAGCRYTMTTKSAYGRVFFECHRQGCSEPAIVRLNDSTRKTKRGTDLRGLDSYVADQMFERLPEIEAEAFGADAEIEHLETAAKVARAELTTHAADLELLDALGREAYLARSESLRSVAETAEGEFAEALRQNAGRLQQPVRRLRDDWETMTLDERRELLASVIQAVFVKGKRGPHWTNAVISADRVHLVWFDDPEVDVPRQGRRDYVLRPFVGPDADNPDRLGEANA